MLPRRDPIRRLRRDLEYLLLVVVLLVPCVLSRLHSDCSVHFLSRQGACWRSGARKWEERGLSLSFIGWHSRDPAPLCSSFFGASVPTGGPPSRWLHRRSTSMCYGVSIPVHPVAEARLPPRASYTLEWLLSHLSRDTFNYYDSIRSAFEDEDPTRETLERRLKMLQATRLYLVQEAKAMQDYGAFKQTLQRQIATRRKEVLEQIERETQDVHRQLHALEESCQVDSQALAASEGSQESVREGQLESLDGQTDEAPIANEGIGSLVSLRELRKTLNAPSLSASPVLELLSKHSPKGESKNRGFVPAPYRQRVPAVLLAMDDASGRIWSPSVLRDQLFHFLKTEGAGTCRRLLRENRGVFRKDQALLLHREMSKYAEHAEHSWLMDQLAALRADLGPKLALTRERIEFLEKRVAELSPSGAVLGGKKLRLTSSSANHPELTEMQKYSVALEKLRRRQKATEEELRHRQSDLQRKAAQRLFRTVRWLYKGFREHGSFRPRLLNQWKHRTQIDPASLAPYNLPPAGTTPSQRRDATRRFTAAVAGGHLFAACKMLRCETNLLEFRSRPKLVGAFHKLYAALNARSKELFLERKAREAGEKSDDSEQNDAEVEELPPVEVASREECDFSEENQARTLAVRGASRTERFKMRKMQRKQLHPGYCLPQYLKQGPSAQDADEDDSSLGQWDGVFSKCTEEDIQFLRKVYISTIRIPRVQAKLFEAYGHWGKEQHRLLIEMGMEEWRQRLEREREAWFARKGIDIKVFKEAGRRLQELHDSNIKRQQEGQEPTASGSGLFPPGFDFNAWLESPVVGLMPGFKPKLPRSERKRLEKQQE